MEAMEKLFFHVKNRLSGLRDARGEGKKVIGFPPGGYLPEELVLASGAIPVCLVRAGDHSMVEAAGAYICRWFDPFCRAQIGYAMSGEDPYYNVLDLFAIPVTDNHIRAISDTVSYNSDIEVFPFGVPHKKDKSSFEYYLEGIKRLRGKLEDVTGKEITDSELREKVFLCNRERELLREISLMRRGDSIPLSSRDFIGLNHASFIADKGFMVEVLELLVKELKEETWRPVKGPRILLTGSTLAQGDLKVLDMIESAGGEVVIEEFGEGIRPYWYDVEADGDIMINLAEAYFMKRVAPAWFRPGRERLNLLVDLAVDFDVDGVIWYHLMYRESYKVESYFFPGILKEKTGLSMLTVESDYDATETGPLQTRIETFIETIRG